MKYGWVWVPSEEFNFTMNPATWTFGHLPSSGWALYPRGSLLLITACHFTLSSLLVKVTKSLLIWLLHWLLKLLLAGLLIAWWSKLNENKDDRGSSACMSSSSQMKDSLQSGRGCSSNQTPHFSLLIYSNPSLINFYYNGMSFLP